MKALKRRGFINHGSTLLFPSSSCSFTEQHVAGFFPLQQASVPRQFTGLSTQSIVAGLHKHQDCGLDPFCDCGIG